MKNQGVNGNPSYVVNSEKREQTYDSKNVFSEKDTQLRAE